MHLYAALKRRSSTLLLALSLVTPKGRSDASLAVTLASCSHRASPGRTADGGCPHIRQKGSLAFGASGEDARPLDFAQGRLPAAGTAALPMQTDEGRVSRK